MTNGQDKERKPVYNGLISAGEYEAVVVKLTEMPPTEYGTSIKVLFLIDNIQVSGVSYIYFVSGFYDKNYKSNSKTAKLMAALGQDISGLFPLQGGLIGKKCKIYIEPGAPKYNAKLGREVQYMQIKAVNPANRVVPNPVAHIAQQAPVQPSFVQAPIPAPQPVSTVAQPQYNPVQATQVPVQPFVGAPANTPIIKTVPPQTQSIPTQPSFAQQPTVIPTPAPTPTPTPVVQPVQTVAPAQVQQAEQPLPQATFTSDDLDF